MENKFKKLLFIWLGTGLIITSLLCLYQRDSNYDKKFTRAGELITPGSSYMSERVRTYYEYVGVATVGGALVILGLGFKEKKEL